jgi:hypothetical protein
VATRAVVTSDLHVKDPRLGRREIGDGPSTDRNGLTEPSAAFGALLQSEFQGRGVRNGALPRAALVARLATRGFGVTADRSTVEYAARRNTPDLSSSIGGGKHRGACLVAPELVLEAAILLLQFPVLLLDPVGPLESFPELLAIGRIDGDGLIILGRSQSDGGAYREQSPLGIGGSAT